MKCDYIGCSAEGTAKGHIYGHVKDSGSADQFLPVNACDKHKQEDGFFEDPQENPCTCGNRGGIGEWCTC